MLNTVDSSTFKLKKFYNCYLSTGNIFYMQKNESFETYISNKLNIENLEITECNYYLLKKEEQNKLHNQSYAYKNSILNNEINIVKTKSWTSAYDEHGKYASIILDEETFNRIKEDGVFSRLFQTLGGNFNIKNGIQEIDQKQQTMIKSNDSYLSNKTYIKEEYRELKDIKLINNLDKKIELIKINLNILNNNFNDNIKLFNDLKLEYSVNNNIVNKFQNKLEDANNNIKEKIELNNNFLDNLLNKVDIKLDIDFDVFKR